MAIKILFLALSFFISYFSFTSVQAADSTQVNIPNVKPGNTWVLFNKFSAYLPVDKDDNGQRYTFNLNLACPVGFNPYGVAHLNRASPNDSTDFDHTVIGSGVDYFNVQTISPDPTHPESLVTYHAFAWYGSSHGNAANAYMSYTIYCTPA